MSNLLGFIGEDKSDLETFEEILSKYIPRSSFKFKKFLGKGHGKINSKVGSWTKDLLAEGCKLIFVIQDLDSYLLKDLKASLEKKTKIHNKRNNVLIIIPVIEMESWLLTDADVLKRIFNLKSVPFIPSNPELSKDPKKDIADIVRKHRNNPNVIYINTAHNKKIAKELSILSLMKCKSFHEFDSFITKNKRTLK